MRVYGIEIYDSTKNTLEIIGDLFPNLDELSKFLSKNGYHEMETVPNNFMKIFDDGYYMSAEVVEFELHTSQRGLKWSEVGE